MEYFTVPSQCVSYRYIHFCGSQGQRGWKWGLREKQQETLTLCHCTLKVLCSLASVSLSKIIAIIHCTNFLKVCSCIQFSLFIRQFLHGYYVESYELYVIKAMTAFLEVMPLRSSQSRGGVRGRMTDTKKEVTIIL